jgi:hypothetical protein
MFASLKEGCACMREQPLPFPGQFSVLLPRIASHAPFVALLIDGDNIQLTEAQLIQVLQEAGSLGEVIVRRVYGNWAAATKSAWKELVLRYAMKPCHHIHGAPGKNATDIALTVEAMDVCYAGITHFCLVTSDSDYTPLIQRLRSSGCYVLGIGNPAKNASLIPSCDRFLPLAQISPEAAKEMQKKQIITATNKKGKGTTVKQETVKKAAPSKKKATTIPATPAPAKGTKPLDDHELTGAIEQAFNTLAEQQQGGIVLLVNVAKAVKELVPTLRAKDSGKPTILFVIKERTDLFVFRQIERDGKQLDEMRRRGKSDEEETFIDKEHQN